MLKAPNRFLSLGVILDEYITLKEQKICVDQERCHLEQEKFCVQNLLKGMHDVMNAYNSSVVTPPPLLPQPHAVASRKSLCSWDPYKRPTTREAL